MSLQDETRLQIGTTVTRRAAVAVVVSSSEAVHYPDRNQIEIERAAPEWVQCVFVDEGDVGNVLSTATSKSYAALLVTPGAMQLPAVRKALTSPDLWAFVDRGGGVAVLATTLSPGREFRFVPHPELGEASFHAATNGMEVVSGEVVVEEAFATETDATVGDQHFAEFRTALQSAVESDDKWRTAVSLRSGATSSPLIRTAVTGQRVALGVVAFGDLDATAGRTLLTDLLRWLVRSSTYLVIGDPTPLGYIPDGDAYAVVGSKELSPRDRIPPWVGHVRLCPVPGGSMRGLPIAREALHAFLEQGGSVSFTADMREDLSILAHLVGEPQYMRRVSAVNDIVCESDIWNAPTFVQLAYAALVRCVSSTVQTAYRVPAPLSLPDACKSVQIVLRERASDGNVDGLLIPTANLFVAAAMVGLNDEPHLATMRDWLLRAAHADGVPDSHVWGARWALHVGGKVELLQQLPRPSSAPASVPGKLAQSLDAVLFDGARDLVLDGPMSSAERALHRYALTEVLPGYLGLAHPSGIEYDPDVDHPTSAGLEEHLLAAATSLKLLSTQPLWSGQQATLEEVGDYDEMTERLREQETRHRTGLEEIRTMLEAEAHAVKVAHAELAEDHRVLLKHHGRLFSGFLAFLLAIATLVNIGPWVLYWFAAVSLSDAITASVVLVPVTLAALFMLQRTRWFTLASPTWYRRSIAAIEAARQ